MAKHLGCAGSNCGYYWQDENDDYPRCHYPSNDPFPAPCEEDDWDTEPAEEEDEKWSCARCFHEYSGSPDSVSCCACCENGDFFTPIED